MADYVVSALKYRPRNFESLIGQDNIAKTLRNSIGRGELAHAYLFCGPRGVGKTTTARIFAKMINCESPLPNGEPCGECESCVSFAENRSYCIHELDAASNNGVDDIKALIEQVHIPPQTGKFGVYIIDEVHMLSSAAFNAFLKTLEEPPAHAIFILATTEKHKILPTILSRCQTYDFNRISVSDITRNLRDIAGKEGVSIDDESLHVIAMKADGAMRDALTIFDQTIAFCGRDIHYADVIKNLNVLDYEYCFTMVENFLACNYASALRSFDEILSKGFNALYFVSALSSHLRDLMVAQCAGAESLLEMPESLVSRYRAQAASCGEKFIYDALNLTTVCEQGYRYAVNPRLHIEFTLMKLCFLNRTPVANGVAAQVVAQTAVPASNPALASAPRPVPEAQAAPVKPAPVKEAPAPAAPPAPAKSEPAPKPVAEEPATSKEEPVPVQTEKTEAATEPQADTAAQKLKRRPSISLRAMKEKEEADKAAISTKSLPDTEVSDDAIMKAWNELCEMLKSNERQYSAFKNAEISIDAAEGVKTLTYKVENRSLYDWLEPRNQRVEAQLCKLAGSGGIKVVLGLVPQREAAPVGDENKARAMAEKNPEIGGLIKDLKLEIR